MPQSQKNQLETKYRSLIGSLLWLSQGTRPDLATVTCILARHPTHATPSHIDAANHVIKYLKSTNDLGILFKSGTHTNVESYIKFPIPKGNILSFSDANWGPQDQSVPNTKLPTEELELFKSRSISGFIIYHHGPIHWVSKRQTITARSSAEAEIYATDECVKYLLYIKHILQDLDLDSTMVTKPFTIYNDNQACIDWSKTLTSKGLRHITIRNNAVRESVQNRFADIKHIEGKLNPSDGFTKEEKDTSHFLSIRDILVSPPLNLEPQIS